jgi:hypothetical protein
MILLTILFDLMTMERKETSKDTLNSSAGHQVHNERASQ